MRLSFWLLISVLACLESFSVAVCPVGDLDGDCSIGLGDMIVFAEFWLDTSSGGANLDGMNSVDIHDFSILSEHWGKTGYQLVINELMADNKTSIEDPQEAGEYPDWFELYNYGTTPIDVGGMYLTDELDTPTLFRIPSNAPAQTTIQPGDYLLVWADGDTVQGPLHTVFKLAAGGEELGLFASDGSLIDSIIFGSQGLDESYGRYPNGGPGWQKFDKGKATPGSSNGGESADTGILINEIMYHPGHDELAYEPEPIQLEYIELYNTGTSAVNLGGWRFIDGIQFELPPDTMIGAGNFLVIAADVDAFSAAYPTVTNAVGGWTGKLTNSGEKLTLINAVGTVIDTVRYHDEGEWAQRILGPMEYYHRGWEWSNAHDGGGSSLELVCPSVSNDYGRNWQASQPNGGTPGRVNSRIAANLAPVILDVQHSPVIPAANQAVTVTAKITDEDLAGVAATLYWRLDASTYIQSQYPVYDPATYDTATLLDDGVHGDGQAGDGVYGATIPAQADGAIIEFFVKADDAAANERTWPAPCDVDGQLRQVANCLYQVDDAFDPAVYTAIGAKPVYYLIMTESERARLADIGYEQSGDNNERYSRAQMNGTFISVVGSDIQCRYSVGYRDRGEGSSGTPPNNVRINFRSDNLWDGAAKINCNSKYTFLQVAGSQLYRSAGLHATQTTPVQLYVNGTQPALTDMTSTYGYYAAFRPYDGDWLDEFVLHDPNAVAGNIYKASSPNWKANFNYRGTNPATYVADGYSKSNNEAENDWSDLFRLTSIMSDTQAPDYVQQIKSIIDTKQWMRWFAMCTLIGYNENGLATSCGDDYVLYRTGDSNRFQLLIYDLDTILHVAHGIPSVSRSIFYQVDRTSVNIPLLDTLFAQPEFVQEYYEQLWDLIETFYPAENFNPLLDQIVKGWVPDSMLADMKDKTAQRIQQALLQIPLAFNIQSSLSAVNGYPQTTANTAQLSGHANAVTTHSVYVNGVAASWNPINGAWSAAAIALLPGVNRITVETYGTPDNSGTALQTGTVDIWYDDDTESTLSGTQTVDRTLTAGDGPWHITADVVIPAGVTITIEPGTTLFFENSTGITVNGCLRCEGEKYRRIHMAPTPGQSRWDGIAFSSTLADNRLNYVDMIYGDAQGKSINIQYSRATLDHMTWVSTNGTTQILDMSHPSALITHCVLPSIGGTETVHGTGLSGNEYLIFEGNTFGSTTGYNDIVDFTGGQRPGPIIQFYNNTFMGGGDDGPDLDSTDAHVEGNLFQNFHQTTPDQDSPSYGVATGDQSQVCIVRNVFLNNDHAILHKEDVYTWTQNNTIINCAIAAISFGEPFRSTPRDPGKGTYLDSNIFLNNAAIFEHYFDNPVGYGPTGSVGVYRSLLPAEWHSFGQENIDGNPILKDPLSDWTLSAGSPAIGTGSNGQNMGAGVPAGASVFGEPDTAAVQSTAVLTVSGPGITHYKYRLIDNGAAGVWSEEMALPINSDDFPLDPNNVYGQIHLTGLQNGHTYHVDVIGKNSAGLWQGQQFRDTDFFAPGNPEGNSSAEWTVNTSSNILRINEVLADNRTLAVEGTTPDIIELYYDGAAPLDIGGYRLTDNKDLPDKFVFAAGTVMNPGDYRIIYADANSGVAGIHTGFSINADGDDLYLINENGQEVDSVVFGVQLADRSIGRTRQDRSWALTVPTLGSINQVVGVGDPQELKINEWLAHEKILFEEDRLELFNPTPWPVDMGGLYLTDNPVGWPDMHQIRPLSFIDANGFAVLIADAKTDANHVNFKLNSKQGVIALLDTDLTILDQVAYYQQTTDVSQGRIPDGGSEIGSFDLPTPGAANLNVITTVTRQDLINIEDVWSYDQSKTDLGTSWRNPGYNDTGWPTGAALLYVEGSSLPAPKNTPLTLGANTYYFRKHFTFNGDPAAVDHLELSTVIDDGAVIYLNGTDIQTIRLSGTITYSTYAATVDNAVYESFSVPPTYLLEGDNVIAVEVHQTSSGSTDIVFGLAMDAVTVTTGIDDIYANSRAVLNGLRITEIMYNPATDPNSEFIEVQNISDTPMNLEGVRFTDGIEFVFPHMILDPGQYTVIVVDQTAFESCYGTQITVAGRYAGRLNNDGEMIVLKLAEPLEAAVMRFEYKNGWYPLTDGAGWSLVIKEPQGPLESWQDSRNWRQSTAAGGSPGSDDAAAILINEILAHSHDTDPDWIELYNPTDESVNIGGWYLSDNADNLQKYRIADNTVIDSKDFLVFYEDQHFANPADSGSLEQFALSENGERVFLSSSRNGVLAGYTTQAEFGASETDVSFGWYEKSDGTSAFVSMSVKTPEQSNADPRVGPVVISEIMYNPPAGGSYPADDYEYIELRNITDAPVLLHSYDAVLNVTLGWRFTQGIDFIFPLTAAIPANGTLIVARNPAAFTERYGFDAPITVLGPFANDTKLSNSGEMLELSKPGDNDSLGVRYYIHVDSVRYSDQAPWPAAPDGDGEVLQRVNNVAYGDDVINWISQLPTPGL